MIRQILILASLLLPGFDLQAQTVTDPGWTLNSAGTAYAAQSLCIAAATALPSPKPGTSATQKCADTTTITVSTPLPAASAAGAYLTGPTASGALTDAAGTAWTLNAGVVYDQPVSATAAVKAGYSAGVGALLWFGGKIHQQNPACLWWNWSDTTWVSESGPGTTALPPCPPGSSSSSSGGSSSSGSSSSGSSSSSSSGAPPVAFGVRASGSKLVLTSNGLAAPPLLGAVISGCETNFAYARCDQIAKTMTTTYLNTTWRAQHAGTNAVRIHLDACSYLKDPCAPAGTAAQPNNVAADVDQVILAARASNTYVIIDEIWSAPAGQQSIGQPGFADATESPKFWKTIADKYGSQPNVIFDLFNEPFGENVYADWMAPAGKDVPIVANGGSYSPFKQQNNANGNSMVTVNAPYQVEGECQLLTLVRGENATNLVLLSPTGWAGEIENWLASYATCAAADPIHNVGASLHAYGSNPGTSAVTAVLKAGFPVIATEFEVAVGNFGTAASFLALGASGEIDCCPHNWGGNGISLTFGANQNSTTW